MTSHAYTASMLLEQLMSDPAGMNALHLARTGLSEDRWGREYAEAIGQSSRYGQEWPMEQLAAWTMVHVMVYSGHAAYVGVETTGAPHRDKEREANAATLAVLPSPFSATVDTRQTNAPADGMLRWDEPIKVEMATGLIEHHEDGSTAPIPLTYEIPPGRVPLEIGSTLPSRTYTHVAAETGVARWPYGHSRLTLFLNIGTTTADWLSEVWNKQGLLAS